MSRAGVVTSPLNGIKWGIRWGTGIDIPLAALDGLKTGAKKLTDHLPEALQKSVTQNSIFKKHITDFESKYFSDDLNTRVKAQGALAIATGIHSYIFFQLRDPNIEITGGLENTYREEQGQVGLFTMLIQTPWGPWRMPYRWIPIYGQAMAYQATMRDIEQFGMTKGAGNLMGAVAAATANYILETPGLASVERIIKAVQSAAEGNFDRLGKFASQAFAASGDPYLQFRKFVTQGFDPRKPADPFSKYQTQQFWAENDSDDDSVVTYLKAQSDANNDRIDRLQSEMLYVTSKIHEINSMLTNLNIDEGQEGSKIITEEGKETS